VRAGWLAMIGVLLAAGCGVREPVEAGECEPGQSQLSRIGTPGGPALVPRELVDRGACDAARRAGVPVERVEIVSATTETWSDSSLGCPVPGQGGATVHTDGYRLVVRAGARSYDYRAAKPTGGRRMAIRLCES
jgi:hypothetical protein